LSPGVVPHIRKHVPVPMTKAKYFFY